MLVCVKGAGDLASGVALRLVRAGIKVVMTEIPTPSAIRRSVCFSEAVTYQEAEVEGQKARLCQLDPAQWQDCWAQQVIPVVVDPQAQCLKKIRFHGLVDAILAKKNCGTTASDAEAVVALGPGFFAPKDCHAVIETLRGHDLGRVIWQGCATPNTGVPGEVGGHSLLRIIRAPKDGVFRSVAKIGDQVKAGDLVGYVDDCKVCSSLDGILRGLLPHGFQVVKGMKSGDVDPRCQVEHCFTVSDKARALGGAVLEALCALWTRRGKIWNE